MNDARDIGRPAVRALLALVRRELPVLLPARIIWEGGLVVRTRAGRLGMTAAEPRFEARMPAPPERIYRVGMKLTSVSLLKMPSPLVRALEWLSLARSARVRPEKFMHLWLAVLALASYKRPARDSDMKRIRSYTATMGTGVGGVLSPLRIEELNDRFRRAQKARHALIHRNDESRITLALLEDLETAVFELVDFELRKVGVAIPED